MYLHFQSYGEEMKFSIEKNEHFEIPTLTPILNKIRSSDRLTLLILEINIPVNPYMQSFILSAGSEHLVPFLSLIYSTISIIVHWGAVLVAS